MPTFRFAAQALAGLRGWWRPALTLAATTAALMLGYVPLMLVAQASRAVRERGLDPSNFTPTVAEVSPWAFLLLILCPFALGLATLGWCVERVERRSWRTLVVGRLGRIRYRRLLAAGVMWLAIAAASDLFLSARGVIDVRYVGDWSALIPVLLAATLLVPVQAAFEELGIRGYLLQHVALTTSRPLWGILVSSVVFGALHFANPEVGHYGLGPMAVYYIGVGLFLAGISVLDDGLELAVGIHAATNLYAVVAVGYEGSALPMPAAFATEPPEITVTLLTFVIRASLICWVFAKAGRWRLRNLTRPVTDLT